MDSLVTLEINQRQIGDKFEPYFIAEAGLNHNGNVKTAKKLVEEAFSCGADAIKFQTYKSEEFLSSSSEYFNFFKDVELSQNEFEEISDNSKLFMKVKKMIDEADKQSRKGFTPYGLLISIIFKNHPTEICLDKLDKSNFILNKLPKNPYL